MEIVSIRTHHNQCFASSTAAGTLILGHNLITILHAACTCKAIVSTRFASPGSKLSDARVRHVARARDIDSIPRVILCALVR